jgi:uncharacterized protein with PQ loop repeat
MIGPEKLSFIPGRKISALIPSGTFSVILTFLAFLSQELAIIPKEVGTVQLTLFVTMKLGEN